MSRVMSSPSALFVLIMLLSLDLFECRPDEGSYVATSDVLQLEDEESLMAAVTRNKLIFVVFQVSLLFL